jgi:hypothetical protein
VVTIVKPVVLAVTDWHLQPADWAARPEDKMLRPFIVCTTSVALIVGTAPERTYAQTPAPVPQATASTAEQAAEKFNTAQLDAMLAPIALYPDVLLTQVLMATVNLLEIVAARRWLAQANNKQLAGADLEDALMKQNWDPAVKSLIPFPQVLEMLDQNLEWTQQLGYAMQVQQPDVFDSIQRLRLQAHTAGKLQTTQQQIVRTEPPPRGASQTVIIIEPAQPTVVYVPVYNPNVVFGAWPYAAVPPVFFPPPPGYAFGSALVAGIAFATGVAVVGSLWGWARPGWGRGGNTINVNVNRWNTINVNRPWQGPANGNWRPNNPNFRPGGSLNRPAGPVGRPTPLSGGLPRNAIGRPGVSVPANVVRPPAGMGAGANRPGIGQPGSRPDGGRPAIGRGGGSRPGGGEPALRQRPGDRQLNVGQRPAGRPASNAAAQARPGAPARQPPALGGMRDGRNAQAFADRGAQSRQAANRAAQTRQVGGGGAPRAGGGRIGGRRG